MRTGAIYKKVTNTYTTSELQSNGTIKGMAIGTLHEHQGKTYKLVYADGTIAVNSLVKYKGSTTTYGALGASVIATAAATDGVAGVAETAITSGDFGWITVQGVASVLTVDAVGAHEMLAASGTAGTAQKAPNTTTVAEKVFGVSLEANGSGGAAAKKVLLQGLI